MTFQVETIAAPAACKRRCVHAAQAEVISAQGEIDNDTADAFVSFLREHVGDENFRPLVLLHSPGGTVVGAMKLGTVFREIGASVVVARSVVEEGTERVHVVSGACMSACAYALFGGKRRIIPSVSFLGIHRMAIYSSTHDPAGGAIRTRSFGTSELVTALSDYTKLMGINPAVIDEAERVSPDSIHIVTPREMASWHLGSPHL